MSFSWLLLPFLASDEELFEDNPEEYIRRDLEGSDAHTRRKSACNLVYALCEAFEGPVITNFAGYINHLLQQYASAVETHGPANTPVAGWGPKDSALLLVTSLAARGKTEKVGATSVVFVAWWVRTLTGHASSWGRLVVVHALPAEGLTAWLLGYHVEPAIAATWSSWTLLCGSVDLNALIDICT